MSNIQKITSAGTSVKQVPSILSKILEEVKSPARFLLGISDVLDMGGGKYDLLTKKFQALSIRNWVYDPFNRSLEHNLFVLRMLITRKADIAICSNVLNVIRERAARDLMHDQIKSMADGRAFFTVYEGDKSSIGRKTAKGWQSNRPVNSYLRELRRHYGSVDICKNKLIICRF